MRRDGMRRALAAVPGLPLSGWGRGGPRPVDAAHPARRRPAAGAARRHAAGRRPGRRTPAGRRGRGQAGDPRGSRAAGGSSATTPPRAWTPGRSGPSRTPTWSRWCVSALRPWRGRPAAASPVASPRCLTSRIPAARFAGDPVFDLHRGGKMEIASTVAARRTRRPVHGLHARRGAGVRGDRRGPAAGRRLHLGLEHRRGGHRRHRGARARRHRPEAPRCRSWRARRCSSSSSAASTPSRSAWTPRTPTRSSRPSSGWRRASAASTSRTSPRRAASRSSSGSRSGSTSRSSTTTSTAPPSSRSPRWRTRCGSPAAARAAPAW